MRLSQFVYLPGILACLDGYMNIAMEQTEVSTAMTVHMVMGTNGHASKCSSGV